MALFEVISNHFWLFVTILQCVQLYLWVQLVVFLTHQMFFPFNFVHSNQNGQKILRNFEFHMLELCWIISLVREVLLQNFKTLNFNSVSFMISNPIPLSPRLSIILIKNLRFEHFPRADYHTKHFFRRVISARGNLPSQKHDHTGCGTMIPKTRLPVFRGLCTQNHSYPSLLAFTLVNLHILGNFPPKATGKHIEKTVRTK